jgi:hypothetical protein
MKFIIITFVCILSFPIKVLADTATNYWTNKAKQVLMDAKQGDAYAQFTLGAYYYSGMEGVSRNLEESIKWNDLAAENGYSRAKGVKSSMMALIEACKARGNKISPEGDCVSKDFISKDYTKADSAALREGSYKVVGANSENPVLEKNNRNEVLNKLSIDKAKTECESLGFKPRTEKFGNCVLELTK